MPDERVQDDDENGVTEPSNGNGDSESDRDVPKLFNHCLRLYELLDKKAVGEEGDRIYVGSISPLVVSIGLASSYQSKLISRLKEMGSIAMLKRGSGAAKSVWGLYKTPTLEDFYASDNTGDIKWRKDKERIDAHTQRLNDINRRVTALEDWAREKGMPV